MSKRIVLIILVIQFLTIMVVRTSMLQTVGAVGTVYIREDGRIEPPTAPILNVENVYQFTADVYDSIVVEKDNIVIDGAGYTLTGMGSGNGIDLSNRKKVTVKNIGIEGFLTGIYAYDCSNITITAGRIGNNTDGIFLAYSSDNSIFENSISANDRYGIYLDESSVNIISKNIITRNQHGIRISCSGPKPESSMNSIFGNSIVANAYHGIWLYCSTGNVINENKIEGNGEGIFISSSGSNFIYHNSFIGNELQTRLYESWGNDWDEGYPSGGNFWSNFNPADEDLDMIGDSPYLVDEQNVDHYPLIYPYGFVPKSDVNEDGVVNILDISLVATAFGSKPGNERWNSLADIDLNETINIVDGAKVAIDFGKAV